jgi:hypothetical protein
MGEVYRARDARLDRDVALKILPESFASDPDRLMRFEREAKTLASLNHPNIAAIYGIEERALVMELVEGEDLSTRIARGPVPLDEALPIAKQIAEALEAAHEQGIIHRDLKPANVKIRPDGTVKVLDFGLAKALEPGSGIGDPGSATITSPAMTMQGVILGTAAYMAPEQARGKPLDRRADAWAFGVVLYEMLTGRRAFAGDEMSDVLAAVLRQPIDWTALPSDTPASVRRLLRRCLEKDRSTRLGDMGTARLELNEARAGDEVTAVSPRAGQKSWRWMSAGLALLSVVLASALIGWPAREVAVNDSVLRFTLVDDPTMEIHFGTQPFATSPDGKTIVFSAAAGSSGLWARSLDQPAARFLAGSEGGLQPAISPDGQWVAFVVANHIIRKVRLSGGGSTTVVSIDDVTASLAWGSDEEILFEKIGSAAGIHRVSANGGEPQLLIPLSADELGHYVPFVLREPRLVFYSSTSPDGRETAAVPARGALDSGGTTLAVFSPADGRRNRLDLDGFRALGLIDGHLLYARSDGSLMAVPFDARALRVLGEPRLLEPKVSPGRFGPSVTLSEDGTLVSLPGRVSALAASARRCRWTRDSDRRGPCVRVAAIFPRRQPNRRGHCRRRWPRPVDRGPRNDRSYSRDTGRPPFDEAGILATDWPVADPYAWRWTLDRPGERKRRGAQARRDRRQSARGVCAGRRQGRRCFAACSRGTGQSRSRGAGASAARWRRESRAYLRIEEFGQRVARSRSAIVA